MVMGRIISIHKLNDKQASAIFDKLKSIVATYKKEEPVHSYFANLISILVEDFKSVASFLENAAPDIRSALLEELYSEIISYYPLFNLDIVLKGYNNIAPVEPQYPLSEEDFRVKKKKVKGLSKAFGFTSLNDIENFRTELKSKLIGQDIAIDTLLNYIKLQVAGLEKKSSFFFIGPTGVGKTYLAKLLGDKYSGNFFKIDCGGMASGHELHKLLGSPPGYIGSNAKSILFEKSSKSNKWVILFDEVEKAHVNFHNILLSLLDEGTIQDNSGNVLDFKESIFIFTSNKGLSDIKQKVVGFSGKSETFTDSKDKITDAVNEHFSPEFRNRIDEFVYFNNLTKTDAREIVKLQLSSYPVEQTESLLDFIVTNSFSPEYGAREINRFIKRTIGLEVANAKLSNKTPITGKLYTSSIVNNKIQIINTVNLKKLAEIK